MNFFQYIFYRRFCYDFNFINTGLFDNPGIDSFYTKDISSYNVQPSSAYYEEEHTDH